MLPLVTHPIYAAVPLPPRHPFPMGKFRILANRCRDRGWLRGETFIRPEPCRIADLERVHTPAYIQAVLTGAVEAKAQRRAGLPWSPELAARSQTAVGGTLATARAALQHGAACHLAGGTHHALADCGAGYCIFNDLAVTAATLLATGEVQRLAIIDADVHQGDGSARLLADMPAAFTCSLHAADNFPLRKAVSDLDVPLPRGLGDSDYLSVFSDTVDQVLAQHQPDLVLYDAGVDVHIDDRLGYLALTDAGIAARDRLALLRCRQAGVPVACVIGGGYADDLDVLAARHQIVVEQAVAVFG